MQCECMYFEAEAAVLALKHRKAAVAPALHLPDVESLQEDNAPLNVEDKGESPPADPGAPPSEAAGGADAEPAETRDGSRTDEKGKVVVRAPPEGVEELQKTVASGFVNGMQKAIECKQPWAVINGAVYCWNAYLSTMKDGWCVARVHPQWSRQHCRCMTIHAMMQSALWW